MGTSSVMVALEDYCTENSVTPLTEPQLQKELRLASDSQDLALVLWLFRVTAQLCIKNICISFCSNILRG